MTEQNSLPIKKSSPSIIFLSWFHTGFFPYAPGTIGSLAAIPLLLLFEHFQISLLAQMVTLIPLWAYSCFLAQRVQKKYKIKDPSWIVFDEVLGMWTTFLFYQPTGILQWSILFLMFRFFDIFKLPPAKQLDGWEHGIGTISDDIISGIYSGLVLISLKIFIPTIF